MDLMGFFVGKYLQSMAPKGYHGYLAMTANQPFQGFFFGIGDSLKMGTSMSINFGSGLQNQENYGNLAKSSKSSKGLDTSLDHIQS